MKLLHKSFCVCLGRLRRSVRDVRVYGLLLLLLLFLLQYTGPMFAYAAELSYPLTPWLLPFMLTSQKSRLITYGTLLLLFANLFAKDRVQKSILIRSGRKAYLIGTHLYIITVAFSFPLVLEILLVLPHLSQIYFSTGWGKFLGLWTVRQAQMSGVILYISADVISSLSAASAMGYSILLLGLTGAIIGEVIFLLDSFFGNVSGIICAFILIGMDYFMVNGFFERISQQALWAHIFPLWWSNLDWLRFHGEVQEFMYPSVQYALAASSILLMVLILASFLLDRLAKALPKYQFFQLY